MSVKVVGSGLLLAVQVNPAGNMLPPVLAAQVDAAPLPPAAVGQAPPFYDANIDAYQHGNILLLIDFYNDNFGVVVGDSLVQRKLKLCTWMMAL